MTRKKDTALAQPVNHDKWERQRNAERITVQDRKTVPHLNSTTGGRYEVALKEAQEIINWALEQQT